MTAEDTARLDIQLGTKIDAGDKAKHFEHMNFNAKKVMVSEFKEEHLLFAERHVGEVVAFPQRILPQLAALDMFTPKQGFQYMRQPVSVIRANSGLVARKLLAKDLAGLGTRERRVIVAGKAGSGKSFMLLQIATMALMQNYVVIAVRNGMASFWQLTALL